MAEWTSLQDIMKDLSVAQGCVVPASLETYSTGPPRFSISEEENEEHEAYYGSEGGGDFTPFTHPDFELIQQMLHMVKQNKEVKEDISTLSSDLDPLSPEFVTQKTKKKISRNVAMSSILEAENSRLAARRPVSNSVIPIMFKRKSSDGIQEKTKRTSQDEVQSASQVLSPEKCNSYTPSHLANEYYNKYLEKSKLREQFEVDIWSKAESKMKEIDGRKKREADLASPQELGYDMVSLPQHRHRLTGQCVVCSVSSKHGYTFEDDISP